MEQKKNAIVICLSPLSVQQLESVHAKILKTNSDIEFWYKESNIEVAKWINKRSLAGRLLFEKNKILFSTPDPSIKLQLPENFVMPGWYFFVCESGVSSDNYLLGAVYHLFTLIKNNNCSDFDFPDYLFENYLYFRKNSFLVFTKNLSEPLTGNAWEIDSFLIRKFRLKKDRLYRKFFRYLEEPLISGFNGGLIIDKMETGKRLYQSMYGANLFFNNIKVFFGKFSNAFSVFYTMVSFKLKRKFKR